MMYCRTIWSVVGYPDMQLTQSITGFQGWIQHCIWSPCDNFLVVVSDALLYVYHCDRRTRKFEVIAHFKPHDSAVSDVCFVKREVLENPIEVEASYTHDKQCSYSFHTCAYDGTIGLWHMQDIMNGQYLNKGQQGEGNVELSMEAPKWDANVMSYPKEAVECLALWGK